MPQLSLMLTDRATTPVKSIPSLEGRNMPSSKYHKNQTYWFWVKKINKIINNTTALRPSV